MAFDSANLTVGRRLKGDKTVWFYGSDDTLATQIGSGYFNAKANDDSPFRIGDTILAVGALAATIFVVTANNTVTVTVAQLTTSAGAEPSDGDKGDVVVSGSGLVWTLDTVTIGKGGTGQTTAVAAADALATQGSNIASASTTNIAGATGRYVLVTGTTTITALGTAAAGVERIVQFTGALTLTHNATSLILPGAANITTAAGDIARFVSEGSGNWRCIGYLRVGGLATQAANNVAITGGSIAGITDLAIADGGTGASSAANARTNLGVAYATAAQVRADAANVVVTPDVLTPKEWLCVPVSDETSNLTTGTAKVTFRWGYAIRLSAILANVAVAPTGANIIVNVKKNGTTIFSTNLSIDAGEKTSASAATAVVISVTDFAADDECTIDVVQVGSTIAGAGLKVNFIGNRL